MSESARRVATDERLSSWVEAAARGMSAGLQSDKSLSLANLGSGNLAVNGSLKVRSKPKRLKPRGTWKKLRRCRCGRN